MADTPEKPPEPAVEARQKRRRIARSFFPRTRLFLEVMHFRINEEETFEQAAALTYKTLFSLIPVFVLSLLILSAISASPHKAAIAPPPPVAATDPVYTAIPPPPDTALDVTVKKLIFEQLSLNQLPLTNNDGLPVYDDDGNIVTLADFITPLLDRAKAAVTTKATGIVAFAILVYGALSLMVVIEGAFNKIYGSVRSRSWPRRLMLYWCVLTLGPLAIGGSIALGQAASATAQSLAPLARLLSPAQAATSFAIVWLLLFLMFKLVPDTRVGWRSATLGSLVAAILWELGKFGFGLYVQHSVKGSWYGSLGLIPLFMLWIYLTWTMVLLGLHVAYVHQHYPMLKRQYFYSRHCAVPISDLRWVLSLGVLLYLRFKEGKPLEADDAAANLLLPTGVTRQLLEALHEAKLVHETARGGFTLARPPTEITAQDLLAAARTLCQLPPELARDHPGVPLPHSAAMDALDHLETYWAKSHNLLTLAGETAAPLTSGQSPA